jgi:glyoxylate/hydroxypyruvate reductase A
VSRGALRRSQRQAIFNLGAGVDALLATPTLPAATPIYRLEDAGMAEQMAEYVTLAVLRAYREVDAYAEQQRDRIWQPRRRRPKAEFGVGILGLGVLGQAVAAALQPFGFPVAASGVARPDGGGVTASKTNWGVSRRSACSSACCRRRSDADLSTLRASRCCRAAPGRELARGAAGRRRSSRARRRAPRPRRSTCSDEPLPATHPFWHHPRITITPHTSAVTRVDASVAQVAARLRRLADGLPIGGRVDRNRGY